THHDAALLHVQAHAVPPHAPAGDEVGQVLHALGMGEREKDDDARLALDVEGETGWSVDVDPQIAKRLRARQVVAHLLNERKGRLLVGFAEVIDELVPPRLLEEVEEKAGRDELIDNFRKPYEEEVIDELVPPRLLEEVEEIVGHHEELE